MSAYDPKRTFGFESVIAVASYQDRGEDKIMKTNATSATIRRAETRDIPDLSHVFLEGSGGLYEALYEGAIPDRPASQIVEHIITRPNVTTSLANCWVVEVDEKFAGGMNAFPADAEADDPPDPLIFEDRVDLLVPFERLHVDGSYYIACLAAHPDFRNNGIGQLLMNEAESDARTRGFTEVSLHVYGENKAVRFYERLGYQEVERFPIVLHPKIIYGGDLLLMTKKL